MKLTEQQEKNIRESVQRWTERSIKGNRFPVIMICIDDDHVVTVERGADYPAEKLRMLLYSIAQNL
jgi:hypothetical protein